MSQFDHLKALHVKDGDTADYYFEELGGTPYLTCAPATNVNKAFLNAVMKKSKEASRVANARRRLRGSDEVTDAAIERARLEDIELFVEYIVSGWGNVFNTDGEPVEFTKENCREFLQAIPPEMFADLRLFCLDVRNFRQETGMDPDEQEALQGN